MRALRPMTQEEREFAEQKYNLVIDYPHRKRISLDDSAIWKISVSGLELLLAEIRAGVGIHHLQPTILLRQ